MTDNLKILSQYLGKHKCSDEYFEPKMAEKDIIEVAIKNRNFSAYMLIELQSAMKDTIVEINKNNGLSKNHAERISLYSNFFITGRNIYCLRLSGCNE